ncbi:hypothetical protein E2562_038157 [Oryza meyeriana var. granulata]|uniref:Uncharacterized protein n=1 Tax=Oryza meyeriana var. granulata TaxID=110450 RepID=A0A6G1CLT5_9ORYZ|nr:hypothetical protein E2562_038157 [Oryza meyeriana var. granulata]
MNCSSSACSQQGQEVRLWMGRERDLVTMAGVLEEAVVEAGAAGEEVVNLSGLHVVREAGDEEPEDPLP